MRLRSISTCLLTSALALAFSLSCGGDDSSSSDGSMCGGDGPCGGKLDGTSWKLADACYIILKQPELPSCSDATAELLATTSEGSISFEKDSYERHLQIDTQMKLHIPAKCKDNRECDSFGGRLSSGATLSCNAAASGGCECSSDFTSTNNDSGAYSIRGNKLELVGDSFDYCVKNNKLTLKPTQPIEMSGAQVTSQLQTAFEKN